ncbi:HtaA domain-containing protein [Corynebacterium pygosceleis]|uniref:HtaA domain-containing protein n=1 Tax=Corynebacterium pygosceleis TaxID=2800406 RepID=A0A9Q4GI49_9CORY|nr:HtaA domain-containing protein [Corynebacterium pygosceleis]MCK7637623.1 HtaA domain-containing protein [Corynebacterium pygosceleis]MCK7674814.1 HtaA domain-containing protein [Corynebacterium pygosceleis]MCL0119597.1 HtaA domain-containing protein [Corynebacterium pygosceleis]MCX7468048.1 HtaA domain-containing protein [Corynebacterium pygosceleis]
MTTIPKVPVALITATVLTTGSILVPSAFAEDAPECVTSVKEGVSSWSIKESYLNYLTMPITRGEVIVSDGVTIADKKKGPFEFTVDAGESKIESESKGVFALDGTIVIHGHKKGDKWELDQNISDVKIAVDGTSGEIIADYSSVKYPNPNDEAPYTADDEVIANVTWDAAPSLAAGDVDLSGAKVTLTQKGASELFGGFYEVGQEMAPVGVKASLEEKCTTPEPTSTTSSPEPTSTTSSPEPTSTTSSPEPTSTTSSPEPTSTTSSPDEPETEVEGSSIGPDLLKTLVKSPVNGIMSIFVMLGAGAVFGVILQHLVALFRR